jgi:putative restriction endonuclease
MRRRWPLIYLYGLSPGCYLPVWPVFIVADNPTDLFFTVEVEDAASLRWSTVFAGPKELFEGEELRRRYVTMVVRRRIHQQAFRQRVLGAYRSQCSLCRLRHLALLDAAHITADAEEDGEPVISNGVALCKLHHAAYDKHFISITPDYVVRVRQSILDETDGPMLEHGLKDLHGKAIIVPARAANQPDKDRLSLRHQKALEIWSRAQ